MEYLENGQFNLSYMIHTQQWWDIYTAMDECLKYIGEVGTFYAIRNVADNKQKMQETRCIASLRCYALSAKLFNKVCWAEMAGASSTGVMRV